jgi:hypothetical protein
MPLTDDGPRQEFLHPTPRDKLLKKRYANARWRRFSAMIRARDGRCMVQVSKKCTGRAEVADHIVRPEEGGAMYDPNNARGACRSCNFVRHNIAYFREKADAAIRRQPDQYGPTGRPMSGDVTRFLDWADTLPGVGGQPTDHTHRGPVVEQVHRRGRVWELCPPSRARPVRWMIHRRGIDPRET